MRLPYMPTVCPDCKRELIKVKNRMECHNPGCKVIRVDGDGKVVRASIP